MKQSRKTAGAILSEYALVTGLIAVAAIGAVVATGGKTQDIFCAAANSLASATGSDLAAGCETTAALPELAPNERFVDAPVTLLADFQSVQFPNPETGERVILTSVSDAAALPAWLDAEITSRQAYDPDRSISACYTLSGVDLPICSSAGNPSFIEVPKAAEAYGYQVSLTENTTMPWSNDVSIKIRADGETAGAQWDVTVSREDAPPILNVAYQFEDQVHAQTDTGEAYIPFADLDGEYNVPVWFHIGIRQEDSAYMVRKPCYKMNSDDEPTCGQAYSNTINQVEVPVGASQVGFSYVLPAATLGPDWVATFPTSLRIGEGEGSEVVHEQDVVVVRPNEPIVRNVSFEMPTSYSFEKTDTGYTYLPYADLEGEWNVPVWFHVSRQTGDTSSLSRQPCVKMTLESEPQCGEYWNNTPTHVEVPVGAAQIGFKIDLPDEGVGSDWVKTFEVSLRQSDQDASAIIDSQNITVTRPNDPISRNATFNMVSSHTFETTDSGWNYVPFADLEGDFNVPIWLHVSRQKEDTAYLSRQPCYKMTPESTPQCGESYSNTPTHVEVPAGAAQVGFRLPLPAVATGNDWQRTFTVTLRQTAGDASTVIDRHDIVVIRPNSPAAE